MTDRELFTKVLIRQGFTLDAEDVIVQNSKCKPGSILRSEGWRKGERVCCTFTTYEDGSRVTGARLSPDGEELSPTDLDKELSK